MPEVIMEVSGGQWRMWSDGDAIKVREEDRKGVPCHTDIPLAIRSFDAADPEQSYRVTGTIIGHMTGVEGAMHSCGPGFNSYGEVEEGVRLMVSLHFNYRREQ